MITYKLSVLNIVFILVCLVLIIILVIKKVYKNLKVLRLFSIFLMLLMVLNIKYKLLEKVNKIEIIYLVDNSYSMGVNERLKKIKGILQTQRVLQDAIYTFNEEVVKVKDFEEISVSNKSTKINYCLDKIVENKDSPSIIFLFSDGINNTRELPSIRKQKVFVVPICIKEEKFKDKSIYELRYSKVGFKDLEYELTVQIYNIGFYGTTKVKLVDIETEEVLFEQNVFLAEGVNDFKIKFVPKKVGIYRLKLEIDKSQDEVTYENNKVNFDVNIKKNKLRILYICGQPSAEYYNLRSLLKNDSNIDLVSFVILRNPESMAIVPDEDSALIPFPTYDIFVKDLRGFDILIFENFAYRKFSIPLQYLENIKSFVLNGGSFIMIGGENSFFLGGYKFTPIEDILPVYLTEKEEYVYEEIKIDWVNLQNKLINIFDNKKENELIWKSLPLLGNYQKLKAKDEAVVLLKYKEYPIVCYTEKNKGKVFAFMTNSSWRWRLGNLLSDKYDYRDLYDKFYKNVIYYCGGFENIKNIYIMCDEDYSLFEKIDVTVLLSNINEEIISINSFVILPDHNRKILSLKSVQKDRFYSNFVANIPGNYSIEVVVRTNKKMYKETKQIKVYETLHQEISKLKIDEEYMNDLAKFYDSKLEYLDILRIDKTIEDFNKKLSTENVKIFELYRNPFIAIIFILIFLLDIYIARFR
ncbi:MAG: glutamine amidotransferase [Endomicrobia bacterium]|nr:glutamine amidotransferase [Endomicrobiia bacterium]